MKVPPQWASGMHAASSPGMAKTAREQGFD
jgi:hypothetical protein